MAEPTATFSPLEQARWFAALSGPFDPVAALPDTLAQTPDKAAEVASELARLCDTHPQGAPAKWLLRTPERRDVLRSLKKSRMLRESIAARRARDPDRATRDLLQALLGEEDFKLAAVGGELIAPTSSEHLERLILALDRAGDIAPAYKLIDPLRSALALLRRDERWNEIEKQGIFGRDDERAAIETWFAQPIDTPPVRALYVRGAPGIGKSVLLDDSVRATYAALSPILLRLDFDRAGLDVQDIVGLTMEAARQVAQQLGRQGLGLLRERLEAASVEASPDPLSSKSLRTQLPQPLADKIGKAVQESGRSVLVMLDTLEVLNSRGETHPEVLFRWLDQLVKVGLRPMRVLAAGRGNPLERLPQRIGKPIALDGLPDPAADAMLEALTVPARDHEEIKALADGNPLKLRLAAEAVRQAGSRALGGRKGKAVATDFLYRFLVSRIDNPLLKKIVHPGLVVRRISAELIRDVLAPQLGLGRIGIETAKQLWADLAGQAWLVERDHVAGEFLRCRTDMRAVLLPLIYREQPARSARLDAAAISWFASRPEPWCHVEAGYHQLQLMRVRPSPPPLIDRAIAAQIDSEMLEELPSAARDLVHAIRGERSMQYRHGAAPSAGDDAGLLREISDIIDRQDWIEGEHVIRNVIDTAGIGAKTQAADAIRAFWWRSGRWSRARRMLQDRNRLVPGDHDIRDLPQVLALARLEMRAEFDPRALLRWLDEDERNRSYAGEAAIGSIDDVGRWGALGFILEANGGSQFRPRRSEEPDPISVARAGWSDGVEASILPTMTYALERMQAREAGPPEEAQGNAASRARMLATFNPYAAPALNLSINPAMAWVAEAAKAGDHHLSDAGALLPWNAAPIAASGREHPISGIARLGLFAEWAQAVAYLRRDPDLQLIGRSAEAWRRTVAGQWRYGRAPRGWLGAKPVDATIGARLKNLMKSRDPHHAAMAELGVWSAHPEASGETVWRRLRSRLGGVAARLPEDRMEALAGCARQLLRRRVPSAFVPGAAMLLVMGER